ncbi:MAG: hypothetical protein EAX95_03695 [Candidatus Thorarchaeota archaeon]|nr:hypothetical protein [Candidatus Thorarchaeota archaeon]
MEPLGTITMYFQFLDKEITSEVKAIMKRACSYYDFVLQLCERACEYETPTHLAYLAAVHAWRLSSTKAREKLLQRFGNDAIILSWTASQHKLGIDGQFLDIDKAIEFADEDWLIIELLCLKSWYKRYRYMGDDKILYGPLEKAMTILERNPELKCFASLVHTVRCELSFLFQMHERAYDSHITGLDNAKKFDDQFQIYQLLWTRSSWIKTWDIGKAMELQEEAYRMAKSFGAPQKIAEAMNDMGRISEASGEYDLAIECYQSSIETFGFPAMEHYREIMDSPSFGLSRMYCELENGESGLEWIDTAVVLGGEGAEELPYIYAQRAEALILLERLDEASQQLEICKKLSLQAGAEGYIAICELATAYLEMAQGDPDTALNTLEPGYQFLSSGAAAIYINRFLIALTKAEIDVNLRRGNSEASETWMSKLGGHAREKNLPGIIMLHALLKAEYLVAQGLKEAAIDTLREANLDEYSDTTRTLYQRVVRRLEKLQA